MFRTIGEQPSLGESLLPGEVLPEALHSPRQMPYPPIHSAPSQTTLASTV
jgi:hypothetical protein